MKYVVFECLKTKTLHPVLFGDHTVHKQIELAGCKPVSAGFCRMDGWMPVVWGESESLQLKSEKERDERLLIAALIDAGTAAFLQFDE